MWNRWLFLYSMYADLFYIFPYRSKYLRYRYLMNHLQNQRNTRFTAGVGFQSDAVTTRSSGRWDGPVTCSIFERQKLLHYLYVHPNFQQREFMQDQNDFPMNSRMIFFVMYPHIFFQQSHLPLIFVFLTFLKIRNLSHLVLPSEFLTTSVSVALLMIMVGVQLVRGGSGRQSKTTDLSLKSLG